MKKLSRWLAAALAGGALAVGAAEAATYTLTSASVGAGTICSDLACTSGPTHTLSPTPQGSLVSGSIGVTGTSITTFSIMLSGPFSYSPSGSHSVLNLGPSFSPAAALTSSNCFTVGSTALCGATFRIDTSPLGGSGYAFFTVNLTATAVPEPALAVLLGLAALTGALRAHRSA